MKKSKSKNILLGLIVIFSLFLRLCFISLSHHIYYPDEIHQSLEIAHKIVTGNGYVPWEYLYGLRSYLFPLMLAIPIKISYLLHITDPGIIHLFPEISLILFSLSLPIASFYLCQFLLMKNLNEEKLSLTQVERISLISALITSVWYELIYFSPRALIEVFVTSLLAIALIIIINHQTKLATIATTIIFTCLFLRPQFFPIILPLIWWTWVKFKKSNIYLGFILAVAIFGFTDYVTYQTFAVSIINNVSLSLMSGISIEFGTQPWWYYLKDLTIASSGLWLISLFSLKTKSTYPILISALALIILHSLIPHKEYRFIFPIIPIFSTLLIIGMTNIYAFFNQYIFTPLSIKLFNLTLIFGFTLTGFVTILAFSQKLPYQSSLYGQFILFKDPHLWLYQQLAKNPSVCGIYDPSRIWVYTGGYYHLNRMIPIYSNNNPPSNPNFINILIMETSNDIQYAGLTKLIISPSYKLYFNGKEVDHPGYTAYIRQGDCTPDPNYTSNRSFSNIDSILKKSLADPVNKFWH